MSVSQYLPSTQFTLIALSIALSAGLVYGAQEYTKSTLINSRLSASQDTIKASEQSDWERTLQDIQSQNPSYTLPEPPSAESVSALLSAAQSSNITDTVGRTLLINLTAAKSQGLGDDIPTQDQIINLATAALQNQFPTKIYTIADLNQTSVTNDTLHEYGNAVMTILQAHPETNINNTLRALVFMVENNDLKQIQVLESIRTSYQTIVLTLVAMRVPQTLAPLHLQLINDFVRISQTYLDMQRVAEDPLRGMVGLQNYQLFLGEAGRVFTTIAQQLSKNAIIFNKDEPGQAWSAFLPV